MFTKEDYDRYMRLLTRNTIADNLEVLHRLQQDEHWIFARALAWVLERHVQHIRHWSLAYQIDLGRLIVGFKAFGLPSSNSGIQAIHATIYLQEEERITVIDEKSIEAPKAELVATYRHYLLQNILDLTQALLPYWDA